MKSLESSVQNSAKICEMCFVGNDLFRFSLSSILPKFADIIERFCCDDGLLKFASQSNQTFSAKKCTLRVLSRRERATYLASHIIKSVHLYFAMLKAPIL